MATPCLTKFVLSNTHCKSTDSSSRIPTRILPPQLEAPHSPSGLANPSEQLRLLEGEHARLQQQGLHLRADSVKSMQHHSLNQNLQSHVKISQENNELKAEPVQAREATVPSASVAACLYTSIGLFPR
jgi:hypothetical protein